MSEPVRLGEILTEVLRDIEKRMAELRLVRFSKEAKKTFIEANFQILESEPTEYSNDRPGGLEEAIRKQNSTY